MGESLDTPASSLSPLQRPLLGRARPSRHQPRPTPRNRNGQTNAHRIRTGQNEPTMESTDRIHAVQRGWSRLGSNQRPSACEADALPLSHGTAPNGERRTSRKTSTTSGHAERDACAGTGRDGVDTDVPRNLCAPARVDYCRASHRATISSVARGCGAVGSASPCQGEGRGFESRHPLEDA